VVEGVGCGLAAVEMRGAVSIRLSPLARLRVLQPLGSQQSVVGAAGEGEVIDVGGAALRVVGGRGWTSQ